MLRFKTLFLALISILICTSTLAINQPTAKKILFLGDSYTVGTGLENGNDHNAFPYQLINKLKSHILIDEPVIIATDGDTTKHLLGALNVIEPQSNPDNPSFHAGNYDLVVLSIGINDLFRGYSIEDYEHHFEELLGRSIRFAKDDLSRVLVLSIPAWDASPSVYDESGTKYRANKYAQVRNNMNTISIPIESVKIDKNGNVTLSIDKISVNEKINTAKGYNTKAGIAAEIDRFNAVAMKVIERKNKSAEKGSKIHFIDITKLTREDATDSNTGKPIVSMFAKDGIHYSSQMYGKWVESAYPIAEEILHK